jgi:hypothetical protein
MIEAGRTTTTKAVDADISDSVSAQRRHVVTASYSCSQQDAEHTDYKWISVGELLMQRAVTAIALSGVTFVSTQALAVDPTSQSTMGRHQMIVQMVGCMKKRMSADRSSSYNAAMKACKDQINRERDNLPSGALVASDAPPKP